MIILDLLFYSFIIVVIIQALYFAVLFSGFAFSTAPLKATKKCNLPVSVIIYAKNEADNIKRFLPSLLNQDYPNFEVVLINDASIDDTLAIFETFAKKHNNINIVNVENNEAFWANKKYALTLGIKAAKHKHLLFTAADCQPVSNQWIAQITSHFNQQKTIVLGYGAYKKNTNSFLNKLIRYETLLTATHYFSFAKIGIPYMGVGRNLAYHSHEFFKANGFINHIKIRSGDDDLFINEVATEKNTTICIDPESFTTSLPKTTFKSWFRQKRKHVSTTKLYKFKHKSLLALFYICQVLFWILGITLIATLYLWPFVIGIMMIRFMLQYLSIGVSAKKLNEVDIISILPVLEVSLLVLQFSIFINNIILKPNYWK